MINIKNDHKEIKRGHIFWYAFKDNILPVLVVQNDVGNKYSENTIIIKMSSSDKLRIKADKIPTLVRIGKHEIVGTPKKLKCLKEEGYLLTSDIYTIPKDNLKGYIGELLPSSFEKVEKAILISLNIQSRDD